jgi:hypothetical protein
MEINGQYTESLTFKNIEKNKYFCQENGENINYSNIQKVRAMAVERGKTVITSQENNPEGYPKTIMILESNKASNINIKKSNNYGRTKKKSG